ncbi:O-antigen ligase family protein [Pseudanabaena sp. ABRG5-3]|uniref:O-antigen ligase family protein n=1 Tax=Pseudanabaena sp. ABRG5-3 TaxID=685565 RepID=UPI000DC73609|nr:O-antigen ligase family protein [Pseudanabaena sp. ABRG5-3]BBC24329.1 lipid A core, O-antigen ligase family enzyme [Pseudanabaena sp. ABRG5-3]
MFWKPTEDQEIQLEWKWLQSMAILLPISNVFLPFFTSLLALFVLFRRGWKAIATPISIAYLSLSVWMLLTTITAFDVGIAAGGLANFLPYFLLAAITSYIIRTPSQFIHFLWLLVLSSIFVSGFGILQAIINRPEWIFPKVIFESYPIPMGFSPDRRIQSFFGHFNETAVYLLTLIPIAFHFALGKVKSISKSQLWIAIIALALGICVLILTGSRNAWVLAILEFVVIALYYRQWKLVAGFGFGMLIIAWAVFGQKFGLGGEALRSLLPEGFVNRLASTVDPKLGDYASTANRLNAWQFALSLISQHPIQGWGLRNFPLVAKSMNYDLHGLPHEHNLFLAIAVGSGIPALLGFISIMIWTIWKSLKSKLAQATEGTMVIAAISITACLLSGWLDLVFYEPRISMLLWSLLGAMYGLAGLTTTAKDNGNRI